MTYQQIADKLIYRLGNRTDLGPSSSAGTRIHSFLYDGMLEMSHRLKGLGIRLSQLETRFDYIIPASTGDVVYNTLVTNGRLYAILDVGNLTANLPMHFQEPEAFEKTRLTADTAGAAGVRLWTSFNRTLSVWRKPTASTTIRVLGYLDPAPITAPASQSPECGASYEPGLLIAAEMVAWDDLEDQQEADAAESKFDRWLARKKAPGEHEHSANKARGLRPHPAMTRDFDLGI